MMKTAIFGGVNAAVLTAMNADLSVDLDRMAAHSRWLLANGCNGLGVLGTTGEANSIGIEERMAILDGLVARGIPARRMLPGTGTTNITDTVKLTRHAASLGAPGCLLLPPFFYKNPSEDGLFAYFSEVAKRIEDAAKIYFYHFPAQSAVPITVPLIARLRSAHPGVFQGIKDSSGDFANTKSYVDAFAKDGFEVYCGDDAALHDLLRAGGAGCITAAANVGCPVSAAVYANAGTATADAAQVQLAAIRKAVTSAPLIPGLKALVGRRTGDASWNHLRPPHLPLPADAAQRLFATFDATGLKLAA
ncbi:MAG: dihydrodipicolinate synthase family protein [Rhodospirillales bacterium]|nr:dihydrodipicolinate synthase family protein [Rhodospirillales bacterium]